MKVSGTTRVFALLGRPVAHSLSPRMQNAAFAAMGLDAIYVALDCGAEAVPPLIAALTAAGGGGNVTVPHKAVAAAVVARAPDALDHACNTFWSEEGRAVGTSTDIEGVLGGIQALGAQDVLSWLIVGTGGSAIAAAAAAARCGVRVAVRSRSVDRAREFLERAGALGAGAADPAECAVVLNATPLGLADADPLPLTPSDVPAARYALDLVYRRGETRWVAAMRAAGATALDGREVLLRQGAASFERWFPGRQAPLDIMRAAVRDGLG